MSQTKRFIGTLPFIYDFVSDSLVSYVVGRAEPAALSAET